MGNRPPRNDETRRLIAEMRRRRFQRRRLTLLIVGVTCLILTVGGIALGQALKSGPPTLGETSSSSPAATASPGTRLGSHDDTQAHAPEDPETPVPDSSSTDTSRALRPETTTVTTVVTVTTAVKRPLTSTTQKEAATATPTSSSSSSPGGENGVSGAVVVIDPGHQGPEDLSYEAIGPGSKTTKYKMSKGAFGVVTGLPESEVNLAISFKLKDELEARGISVIMTRTSEDVNISNIARAKMANEAGARLFIRIHCDAFQNSSARGIHVLYPAYIEGWTDDIYSASRRAAQLAQSALIAATGANDRGLDERGDMTGFNWSDVPVIMPELGFMTNPDEDRLLASSSYQQKLATALAEATVRFLRGE